MDGTGLDDLEVMLLGESSAVPEPPTFELASAYQGAEALAKVREALKAGTPSALTFIDMRMPPGWDGVETLSRIWQEDPRLQAVICSAYWYFSDLIVRKDSPFQRSASRRGAWTKRPGRSRGCSSPTPGRSRGCSASSSVSSPWAPSC